MTQPLFRTPSPVLHQLEKRAMRTKLGADQGAWGMDVLDAVYREHPYMKAYELDVKIDRRDDGSGTAVGKVLVYPTLMDQEKAAEAGRLVTLPVIIKDRELYPLDIYTHGTDSYPVDRSVLEGLLSRPEVFGEVEPMSASRSRSSYDSSLNLETPTRNGGSAGFGGVPNSQMTKEASGSCWGALAPYIDPSALENYLAPIRDKRLASSIALSAANALTKVASSPDVVQVTGSPGRYKVKVASRVGFDVRERPVTDLRAMELVGERKADLASQGHVTIVRAVPGAGDSVEMPKLAAVTRGGVYDVSFRGKQVPAFVFPFIQTLEGVTLGNALAVGNGWFAEGEKIAAAAPRESVPFSPTEIPRGRVVPVGSVTRAVIGPGTGGREMVAYEPIDILAVSTEQDKVAAVATRLSTGERIRIFFEPGLRKIAHLDGNRWVFPLPSADVAYLPYPDIEARRGLDDARSATARGDLAKTASTVHISMDGRNYRLWDAPGLPSECGAADLTFSLGVLGVPEAKTKELMKTAAMYPGRVPVHGVVHPTALPKEKVATAGPSSTFVRDRVLPLLASLEKLAAAPQIRGQTPSDLLALDFVTPENGMLYCNFLPDLEKAASQLAEIVLASRLGFDTLRESAAKNAMTQVQSVLVDLRALRDKVR
jgi:hypothetical protein